MLPYILLIAGFAILIKGADFLVAGATSIARRFNISDLVIGLTVVAFGTSSPELFVNLVAGVKGNTDIAIGNILGGKWIVAGAVVMALKLGLSQALVGLTIVAVGTSLPELATSAMAAYKGNSMPLTSHFASCRR